MEERTSEEQKEILYNDAKLWQIAFFSLNNGTTNLYLALMAYVSYYANSVAGFGVVLISLLLTGMKVFDGITDPIIGFLLDKTNGRFGKFRPFLLLGNICMALSCIVLFTTVDLVPKQFRLIYFVVIYALYVIGFTLQTVVGKSGGTVLTNNPNSRPVSTYFDSLFIMAAYGGTALLVSNYLIPKYGGFTEKALYVEFVLWVALFGSICTILAMIGIWSKDKPEYFGMPSQTKEKKSEQTVKFKDYWEILIHNKPIRMLVIAASTDKFASIVYSNTTVGVMLFGIMMQDYTIAGMIGVVTAIPTLFVVSGGIAIAQKLGQKRALVLFTWLAIIFQILMAVLLNDPRVSTIRLQIRGVNMITVLFFVLFVLLNGCKSVTNNMVVPMIADCSDYELYRSGKYVPGLMGALFSFVEKVISALGTTFVGVLLAFAGFGDRLPQVSDPLTGEIKLLTFICYSLVPIIGWIISIWAMRYYELDRKKMNEIQKKNFQR